MSIMDSFYSIIENYKNFDFDNYFQNVTRESVLRSINSRNIDDMDILNLLSPRAEEVLEEMAQRARANSLKYFGRTVLLYTPLYISNYCVNKCVYCGYNVTNTIPRRKLTLEEVELEGKAISEEGFKHLLVLTGESEYHTPVDYIADSIKILKKYFPSLGIEVYPMSVDGYKEVVQAGVDSLTIYQETYDEDKYKEVHLSGPKKNFKNRLDAPERGAIAGMRSIGIGALLGLSNWRRDAFFTALHGLYLVKKYPHIELSYAPPRIRPCSGGLDEVQGVSDKNLLQVILTYKLTYPQGGINISTRESNEIRKNLIPIGISRISASVSTGVGGRVVKEEGTEQFNINDESSVDDVKALLKECGYQPIFKDWERF